MDQIMRFDEVGHTAAVSVYSESILASRLLAGFMGPAVIELDQAAPTLGAPVVGSLTASIAWRY